MKERVDEQLIMERTGHRSTTAVRMYKRTSSDLHKEVSDCLQPPMPRGLEEVIPKPLDNVLSSDCKAGFLPSEQHSAPLPSASVTATATATVTATGTATSTPIATASCTAKVAPTCSTAAGPPATSSSQSLDSGLKQQEDQIMISVKRGDKEVKILL